MKKLCTLVLLLCLPSWAGRGFGTTGDSIVVPGVGTGVDQSSGPMTISFWMFPTSITQSYPFGKWTSTAAQQQYLFCVGDTTTGGGASSGCYYVGSFSALVGMMGGCATLTANHWYQVTVRVDPAGVIGGSAALYFQIGGFATCSGSEGYLERRTAGGTSLIFGCGAQNLPTLCFPGYIGEVAFWNTVLSNSEVSSLASICPDSVRRTSLVAYYKLSGAASPEPDLSGGRNNGTVTGTSAQPAPPCTSPR